MERSACTLPSLTRLLPIRINRARPLRLPGFTLFGPGRADSNLETGFFRNEHGCYVTKEVDYERHDGPFPWMDSSDRRQDGDRTGSTYSLSRSQPQGLSDGLVVQSSLERIVVFTHNHPQLLLSDISHLRRVLHAPMRVGRSSLCREIFSSQALRSLLATLSKIEIVRFNVEKNGLCLSS